METTATVLDVGRLSFAIRKRRHVELAVDSGDGKLAYVETTWPLGDGRSWLVPGQVVPVEFEPGKPEDVEFIEDKCPEMDDRIAERDPLLVDPLGAQAKVAEARQKAINDTPGADRGDLARVHSAAGSGVAIETEKRLLKEALERVPELDSKRGRVRGVALNISRRFLPGDRGLDSSDGDGSGGRSRSKSEYLLSVHVPGKDPFPVRTKITITHKHQLRSITSVLVSEDDPSDIKVDWDETARIDKGRLGDMLSGESHERRMDAVAKADTKRQSDAMQDFLS